jgi:hypothetical protein
MFGNMQYVHIVLHREVAEAAAEAEAANMYGLTIASEMQAHS